MAEQSNLHVLAPPKAEPNQSAIALLEDALERARGGEVIGAALVLVERGDEVATAWSSVTNYHLLNSGAARLAARLANNA